MQTINGKFIASIPNKSPDINLPMEKFTQQLEKIELQLVTNQQQEQQDWREYISQLKTLKSYLENLEKVSKQLLSTTLFTAVILVSLLLWLGGNRQPSSNKSQANNSVITCQS